MSLLKKIVVSLLRILAGVPIVSLFVVGLFFLILSETLKGRSVGLSVMILGGVLFCVVGYWNRKWFRRMRWWLCAVLLPVSLLLYLVPMILAPRGGQADGCVRNCFLRGQGKFSWYLPENIVPEVDQLKVGMCLLPFGDPYMDFVQAAQLRARVLPTYDAMDKDADFCDLGSVMGMAYRELFHMEFRSGHYYVFLPKTANGEKLPCLIFLHGLGGNVKAYLWVLSRLSMQTKCAVIAPTFGLGNWDKAGSAEFVIDVAHEAIATLSLNAALKEPELFKGLIYLSPVTEDEIFTTEEFSRRARGCKILFLHGGRDNRIPRSLVEGTVAVLKQLKCNVRLKVYDAEDHFVLFSQREAILHNIVECMMADSPGWCFGPDQHE